MTKTESAEHTVKTLAIESCEQWLNFKMSAGVRAAIPGTNKLIMVGTPDWIAKNVPDVEELIAAAEKPTGDLTDERAQFEAWMKTRFGYPFAGTFTNLMWDAWQERAAIATHLAGQSQATKVQAVPVAWMTPSDWRAEPLATCDKSVANAWRSDNREVTPLYAAPVEKEVQAAPEGPTNEKL